MEGFEPPKPPLDTPLCSTKACASVADRPIEREVLDAGTYHDPGDGVTKNPKRGAKRRRAEGAGVREGG